MCFWETEQGKHAHMHIYQSSIYETLPIPLLCMPSHHLDFACPFASSQCKLLAACCCYLLTGLMDIRACMLEISRIAAYASYQLLITKYVNDINTITIFISLHLTGPFSDFAYSVTAVVFLIVRCVCG